MSSSPRPYKVVHLVPQDSLGGAETAAREMACRADLTCDFQLLFLAGALLRPEQQRIRTLGFKSPLNPLAHIAAVRAMLRLEPDLLICSLWKSVPAAILFKLLRPNTKLVAFFHSSVRAHGIDRNMHRLLLGFADAIWTDSAATWGSVRLMEASLPHRTISYVIDATPPQIPRPEPEARFVSWSRIHPHKGMERAIDLIARLVELGIDARFDLWGPDQGPRPALERQARDLGIEDRVKFHGAFSRGQLPEIAGTASFLLQLSHLEGMAMVVVEAMQFGLVPVVTAVGEIGSYCHGGENAVIIDPDNLASAARRISALLKDPAEYRRMSEAALSRWVGCRGYADDICDAARELAGQ